MLRISNLNFFILSFPAGIFLANFGLEGDFAAFGFLTIFLLFAIFYFFGKRDWWRGFLILALACCFATLRLMAFEALPADHIVNFLGEQKVRACILDEVDERVTAVKYTLSAEGIFEDGGWKPLEGKFLVNGPKYPLYEYGDCFEFAGFFVKPEPFDDFAYDKYLERYRIYALFQGKNMIKIDEGRGNFFFAAVLKIKGWFAGRILRIFSEPHGSFLLGLLLGSRQGIPGDLMVDFNLTGLTHVIAISGYNITILILIVGGIFAFMRRGWRIFFSLLLIVFFVFLVGAGAAVVRAAIMGVLGLLALFFGRQYFVVAAVLWAAFLMAIFNPFILIYDIGFQLSFMATLGLLFLGEGLTARMPEVFAMTIAAQIMALPVIIYNFGNLSLISPLANFFVLPLIPLAMLFGFLAALGLPFLGFFAYLSLQLAIFFVHLFADFPFANLEMPKLFWQLLLFYYFWLFRGYRVKLF